MIWGAVTFSATLCLLGPCTHQSVRPEGKLQPGLTPGGAETFYRRLSESPSRIPQILQCLGREAFPSELGRPRALWSGRSLSMEGTVQPWQPRVSFLPELGAKNNPAATSRPPPRRPQLAEKGGGDPKPCPLNPVCAVPGHSTHSGSGTQPCPGHSWRAFLFSTKTEFVVQGADPQLLPLPPATTQSW